MQRRSLSRRIWQARTVYLMFLPTFAFFLIFAYIPFANITIAFQDYKIFKGIAASPWVGFENFVTLFTSAKFPTLIRNTLVISLERIIFGFPVPIIFALLLNEVRSLWFKKGVQTITYLPHFLSWVVYGGIIFNFTGPYGIINSLLQMMGLQAVNFSTNAAAFRPLIIITGIMKSFGWNAIIYLAALVSVDPALYEAAKLDGAGKLRQIWHVTLPGILGIVTMMLCMSIAGMMDAGFDQIFMFLNASTYEVGDIIDTYVYRLGLLNAEYELATATGIFKGVVGMILMITANALIRRTGERSLW